VAPRLSSQTSDISAQARASGVTLSALCAGSTLAGPANRAPPSSPQRVLSPGHPQQVPRPGLRCGSDQIQSRLCWEEKLRRGVHSGVASQARSRWHILSALPVSLAGAEEKGSHQEGGPAGV
jgi:hypothetical protein